MYNEISAANIDSFHFHGDLSRYPITALIAVPHSDKSGVLLMGRYQGDDEPGQIVRPSAVMDELLGTILTIQGYVMAAIGIVAIATLATAALVFLLSLRLRQREIETMVKIGAARASLAGLLISEVVFVLVLGAGVAGGLTLLTSRFGVAAIRALLLS